jgi:hypothetical protein
VYSFTLVQYSNGVIHMTDIHWAIQIQHNTVVYLTLNFHPKRESTALIIINDNYFTETYISQLRSIMYYQTSSKGRYINNALLRDMLTYQILYIDY